eukprot:1821655-Rhodomonas_salina.1
MRRENEENTAKMRRELTDARRKMLAMEPDDADVRADTELPGVLQNLEEQLAAVQNKAKEFKDAMHFW